MNFDQLKQRLGPALKAEEPLANHVTFKIGGPAKYFYIAKTSDDFVTALDTARQAGLAYFILGSGSNLLVSDQGFDGLVIKPENNHFTIDHETVMAESGTLVIDLLEATLQNNLIGWSWAAGLPGTIGGAVRGNAGAYGKAMSDIVISARLYQDGKVFELANKQLGFSYRHSKIKDEPTVVLSVVMKLVHGDIAQERVEVNRYNQRREQTQPLNYPNSGCVFKNVDLKEQTIDQAKVMKALDITEAEFAEATKFQKLPVSFILDHLNFKGKKIGGAQVSDKHAAFIVNTGTAKAQDVIMLISDIKMHVRDELGIQLQEEIQLVGF